MNDISIKEFAQNEAQSLAKQIAIVGVLLSVIISTVISINNHISTTSTALSIAETNLAQSLQIGGLYYQEKLATSMTRTNIFTHVWIYDRNQTLVTEGGNTENINPLLTKRGFYFKNGFPHILIKKNISYNKENAGYLYASYKLPLFQIVLLIFIVMSIFYLLSLYLRKKIESLGNNISQPVFNFMNTIEDSLNEQKYTFAPLNNTFIELKTFNLRLSELLKQSKESSKLALSALKDAQVAQIASKVRHDIQGALLIVDAVSQTMSDDIESKDILKTSISRIRGTLKDIPKMTQLSEIQTRQIKNHNLIKPTKLESCNIIPVIEELTRDFLVTNDKIEYINEYEDDGLQFYVDANYIELERLLLNLYKNAGEAIKDKGTITTKVKKDSNNIVIDIMDSGKGINNENLKLLGTKGFTFDKKNGTGLGLFSAINMIKKWNGTLKIDSREKVGTSIKISLPCSGFNDFYENEIVFSKDEDEDVIILDDDLSIHKIWKRKLINSKKDNIYYYTNTKNALEHISKLKSENKPFTLLIDYDLKDPDSNGLEIIVNNSIESNSYLITSNYKDLSCGIDNLNFPIIPKILLNKLPIFYVSNT